MRQKTVSGLILSLALLALSGCMETDRPYEYDKGVYGGKPDTKLTPEQVETLRQRGRRAF